MVAKRHRYHPVRDLVDNVQIIKIAELGGGQDAPFEGAFANLAHAFLRDKAPKLLQYELGFQLLEKSQDSTRSVGVFGFKVGSQTLLAPVFFLNGDLKGHELLYLKSQDAFVPLKENWINELLSKKPSAIGEGVDRNVSRLGVTYPSLYQLSRSPYKSASAEEKGGLPGHWLDEFLPDIGHFVTKTANQDPKYDDLPDLPTFLKEAGAPAARAFLGLCEAVPTLWNATERFYGEGAAEKMVRDAFASGTKAASAVGAALGRPSWPGEYLRDRPAADPRSLVKVARAKEVMTAEGPAVRDLSDDEKDSLLKGRYVVRDHRGDGDVTHAFDATTTLRLQNPTESGIYQVLVKPDEFRNCLVVMAPIAGKGRRDFCVLVDLETKKYKNIHPSRVFVKGEANGDSWNEWFDKLPEATKGGEGVRLLLSRSGQGTCPLEVVERRGGSAAGDASRVFRVHYFCHAGEGGHGLFVRQPEPDYAYGYHEEDGKTYLRFTGQAGRQMISRFNGELQVPDGTKVVSLKGDYDCCEAGSESPPLQPGSLADLQVLIQNHTHPLTIFTDGHSYKVNGGKSIDKEACVLELVVEHGLRQKAASAMVSAADADPRRNVLFRMVYSPAYVPSAVKKANPTANLINGAPGSPGFLEPIRGSELTMSGAVPTQMSMDTFQPVPDMSANKTDRTKYDPRIQPDHTALRNVHEAARTGQKEVFDTAVLGGLLKTVKDDSMVDRYFGVMMKCLDRLGRILFNFYWHQDAFADRYGKADIGAMEDSLRNTFESLGDLLLDLKARKVGGFADDGIVPERDDD
jgi:hypothetical protein